MPRDHRDEGRERGWYLDPDDPHSHRFWTGTRWVPLEERLPDLALARRPGPVVAPPRRDEDPGG